MALKVPSELHKKLEVMNELSIITCESNTQRKLEVYMCKIKDHLTHSRYKKKPVHNIS